MPGKHLLIETESADGDGEGSEPDSKGTVPSTESRVRLAFTFSLKQLSGADVRMTNRGFGCLGSRCQPDYLYRKER